MSPSKFARGNDRRSKREAREQEARILDQEEQGTYHRPDRAECEQIGPFVEAVTATTRLYYTMWCVEGRVVEFLFLHFVQVLPSDAGWYQLARVDCAHGTSHMHEDDQGNNEQNTQTLRVLHTVDDVERAYDDAYDVVFNDWRERERRYTDACRSHPQRRRPTQLLPQGDLPEDCPPGD